jgi:hypothetical protein
MSEEKKGFTVKDRRHFTSDGDVRQAVDEPEPPAASTKQAPRAAAPQVIEPRSGRPRAEPPSQEPVDFASFVFSLGAQAGALLERADLAAARQLIGILEMLKDKTEGRRTQDEDRVIEGLLYELRLAYVETSRTART